MFFIVLILWGSFFTLNLLLAVLEGNFTKGKEDDKVCSAGSTLHPCTYFPPGMISCTHFALFLLRYIGIASFGNVLFSVLLLFFLQYDDVWRRSRNVPSGIFCVDNTKRFKINGSPRDSSNSKTYIVLAIERYLQPSQRVQQKHHPKEK